MSRLERWLVIALCAAMGWFYFWTIRSNGDRLNFGREQRDYYNLLIDGYLEGQLHMKTAVPDVLLSLRNPYDPKERPSGVGLHDASFFKGKYYVYFGAAPMIVLMLPFRVCSGTDLPLPVAVLIYTYAGFLVSVVLWLAVRRRYFSETRTVTVLLGILVLGLASGGAVLLRRPDMWELPIAGGYCFAMLTLAFVWRSVQSERTRNRWLAAAGLCLGLAIASRPTYLIAVPLLAAPLLWWWRNDRRVPWRASLSAVVPLAIVGGLMAWHNYARFENPLEFGQGYQFSLDYESKLPHFRAAYVPFTAKAHFFSAAQWSRYFPFIGRGDLGEAPTGFTIHRGDVYGILIHFPIAWLAFLSPLAWWRRPLSDRGPLQAWLGSAMLLFLLPLGLLLFFFSALARYQMDFLPAFILLACVGLLAVERWLQASAHGLWPALARIGWNVAAVFSAGFGVLFSLQFDGVLHERNPRLEQDVARRLNRIPGFIERMVGVSYGPIEMTLRLPAQQRQGIETLLTVGEAPAVDRVIVEYVADGRVRFGVVPDGSPAQFSRPLLLDSANTHRVRIAMSSLLPPVSHPFFANTSAADVRRMTRRLRIEVNDEPVLIAHHRATRVAGGKVLLGHAASGAATMPGFSGAILATQRSDGGSPAALEAIGPFVRLRVAFNANATATCEPLVLFDETGADALLTVTSVSAHEVKFGLVGPGMAALESPPCPIDPRRVHELVVRFEGSSKRRRMLLWRDGELVWTRDVDGRSREPGAIIVGKNPGAVPGCAARFSGTIVAVQHDPRGRDPLAGSGNRLRLNVRLPADLFGQREPLIVTGRSGAGDMLIAEYVDPRTMRFALDHWGTPMAKSEPISIDFTRAHTIDVVMPSLDAIADANVSELANGELTVAIDGQRVWVQRSFFFPAEAEELVVGRNPLGGTSCGPVFTGDVLSAERLSRE